MDPKSPLTDEALLQWQTERDALRVSEQQARAEAMASEERYRFLAESIPQQVWTALPDGSLDYFNQRCLDFFARTIEQMRGAGWQDVLHPDDLPQCVERWSHSLQTGESYEIEFRLRRASDGAYRWHLGRALSQHDTAGRIVKWFGTNTDIHERKEAEQALQKSEQQIRELNATLERRVEERTAELVRSNQDLQQFAYVASHDLQEPLRMVASYTQLLGRRYRGKLDQDADDFIHYAVDGVNRMQRLINDLLAYSRVGTQAGEARPVDTTAVLARAVADMGICLEEAGAQVNADPLPTVLGDASQLGQLFRNLIGNAVKFHGDEPARIHISAVPEGPFWHFAVRDNGMGIEPQYHERIFVLFQRLHSRADYPGTGLGLSICKKIVERHGGRIWVVSDPPRERGSTFHFTLQAPTPPAPDSSPAQEP